MFKIKVVLDIKSKIASYINDDEYSSIDDARKHIRDEVNKVIENCETNGLSYTINCINCDRNFDIPQEYKSEYIIQFYKKVTTPEYTLTYLILK